MGKPKQVARLGRKTYPSCRVTRSASRRAGSRIIAWQILSDPSQLLNLKISAEGLQVRFDLGSAEVSLAFSQVVHRGLRERSSTWRWHVSASPRDRDDVSHLSRGFAIFDHFWNDDEGLVTLEWVGLAAAVIMLAVGVISVVQGPTNAAASAVGSKLASTQGSGNDQPDGSGGPCSAPGLVIARAHANNHASPCQAH